MLKIIGEGCKLGVATLLPKRWQIFLILITSAFVANSKTPALTRFELADPALMLKDCKNGNAQSCSTLAQQYYNGLDVKMDIYLAAKYFQQSCDLQPGNDCKRADNARMEAKTGVRSTPRNLTRGATPAQTHTPPPSQVTPMDRNAFVVSSWTQDCAANKARACDSLGWAYRDGTWGVAKDANQALAYYNKGCRLGYAQSCGSQNVFSAQLNSETHDQDTGPITELILSGKLLPDNSERGTTVAEGSIVRENPVQSAQLCAKGRRRACFVLSQTITGGGTTVGIEMVDEWDSNERKSVLAGMTAACKSSSDFCYAKEMMTYNMAKRNGFPDPKHPRWCFLPTPQYNQIKSCWVTEGQVTGSCQYSSAVAGYNTVNHCGYPLVVGIRGVQDIIVKPGQSVDISPSEKFEYVYRQ